MQRTGFSLVLILILSNLFLGVSFAQDSIFVTATPSGGGQTANQVTPNPTTSSVTAQATVMPTAMTAVPEVKVKGYDFSACDYQEGQPTSAACIALMEAYPEPDVMDTTVDGYTLSIYSFWRVGPHAVNRYDAPGGNVIGHIPEGFNFINVIEENVSGWLQTEAGDWVQESDAYYVAPSYFTGVRLPENWQIPFGWVLDTTGVYTSLYPGGESTSESGLVPLHYERYTIFAQEEDAEGWTWYLIGPNQWIKQTFIAIVRPVEDIPEELTGNWVGIDLFEQTLIAYEDQTPVFATLVSSGLPPWDTNEGIFTVWARLQRDSMSGSTGAPDAYALQTVPWTMYFDDGISLHGTYWHDLFGYRRSHGCVNVSLSDASFIYNWFLKGEADANGEVVNYVYVFSTGEYKRF
ncbi:hypothetical protein MASR2M15_22320 [Anaerolineales bacterium]